MIETGGITPDTDLSISPPVPFLHCAGCIVTCCHRIVEPVKVIIGHRNLHLADSAGIHILILGCEIAAGDKRDKNKAERKNPQDFMQTLIPQIGLNLVLRLPLL